MVEPRASKAAVAAQLIAKLVVEGGAADVLERLVQGLDSVDTAIDRQGSTPLAVASKLGNAGAVRVLLAHRADPSKGTLEKGNTALFWATAQGHAEVAQLLLDAKADPAQRNQGGDTPVLWACRSGTAAVVELLLQHEPSVQRDANLSGMTPLMCAGAGAHASVLRLLLASSESLRTLDAVDEHGRTALHFAAAATASSSPESVQALLDAGANWSIRAKDGQTALLEARAGKNAEAEGLLTLAWQQQQQQQPPQPPPPPSKPPLQSAPRDQPSRGVAQSAASGQQHGDSASADSDTDEAEASEVEAAAANDAEARRAAAARRAAEAGAAEAAGPLEAATSTSQSSGEWLVAAPRRRGGRKQQPHQPDTPTQPVAAEQPADPPPASKPPTANADAPPPSSPSLSAGAAWAAVPTAVLHTGCSAATPESAAGRSPTAQPAVAGDGVVDEPLDDEGDAPDAASDGAPAWASFVRRHPHTAALDLQLRHVLGEGLQELSMAQLGALQEAQWQLQRQLEEARLQLARRQERDAVEARLALEIERALARQREGFELRGAAGGVGA